MQERAGGQHFVCPRVLSVKGPGLNRKTNLTIRHGQGLKPGDELAQQSVEADDQ
jgi:hypothetical protein